MTVSASTKPLDVNYVTETAGTFADAATATSLENSRYLVGSGRQISLVELIERVPELVPDADITWGTPAKKS